MHPMQFSSGDVVTDRRFDYARMLDESGEPAAAAELMEQALELAPKWAAGWSYLAEYHEKAGNTEAATDALRRLLKIDAEEIFAAQLKLARLGAVEVPPEPPSAYVEALFDDYAERFEESLVEKLDYAVPEKLAAILARTVGEVTRHALAVDLGCGTGLLGEQIHGLCDRLEGFDLSQNMLAKADEKGIYAYLGHADLTLEADQSGLFAEGMGQHRATLACAADVMMYLGNLEAAFTLVDRLTAPGAWFAFSVEDALTADGFDLADSLRYVHSEAYVTGMLSRFGFAVHAIERTPIRKDGGNDVLGILFVAGKRA